MQNGGKRPGAGRKKGSLNKKTIEKAEARAHLVKTFLASWDEIIDTMLSLALGKEEIIEIQGKFKKVYTRAPDNKMLQVIVETVIGKPKPGLSEIVESPQLAKLSKNIRSILEKN